MRILIDRSQMYPWVKFIGNLLLGVGLTTYFGCGPSPKPDEQPEKLLNSDRPTASDSAVRPASSTDPASPDFQPMLENTKKRLNSAEQQMERKAEEVGNVGTDDE